MKRPRLLYVPIAAALEAGRFVELADWAEVALFDAPGAATNRDAESRGVAGVVDAALARLDALGWDRYGIVCDGHSQAAAVELALRHRDRIDGVFIGHAAAHYGLTGERPAMVPSIHEAASRLLTTDYRSFARALTQMTQGLVDDAYVEEWIREVPQPVAYDILGDLAASQPGLVTRLSGADLPVLLGKHVGCVMWTAEAFDDAAAAVPEARTIACDGIPTHDAGFLAAMRDMTAVAG